LGGGIASGYFDQQKSKLHPNVKGRFEFWGDSSILKSMELKKGTKISLKTKGDSSIVESCGKITEAARAYSGQDVLGNWTGKLFELNVRFYWRFYLPLLLAL
jgi:hypothetical protein